MGLLHPRSRSQRRFKMLVHVCSDDIFWITEHFVFKPGMVMQHHKPEYHAEKLVHCVQCQGHSEGLYNQNMIISAVSSKLLVGLQPNLVWLYNIISQNVLLKNGITAFKVKVTTKVQNVSECLSRLYFLNHRAFCYQIWYGDAASWARVSCRNFIAVVAIFKVKVTVRVIWSKYDSFYYIFWTVDCLATKLGLMIHYHKPEYQMKKVGLHHSGSRSQRMVKMLMFVQMIFSKPPRFFSLHI